MRENVFHRVVTSSSGAREANARAQEERRAEGTEEQESRRALLDEATGEGAGGRSRRPVSYTHLTLPTKA